MLSRLSQAATSVASLSLKRAATASLVRVQVRGIASTSFTLDTTPSTPSPLFVPPAPGFKRDISSSQSMVQEPAAKSSSTQLISGSSRPTNVGIIAMDTYFPSYYVAQEDLERFDNVSSGKYTVGLGQQGLAFVTDREDIYSITMTAVANLLEKYKINPKDIGRLEVATETILDHSKSIKTVLMQLFADSGNTDIEGVDSINACYAGTNALFNSMAWIESSAWDGRYALVVATDIAEYAKGAARPTGGCAAVAFLVGPNAPVVFEPTRASHMEHVYDFYKPHLESPYPVVDGKYSNVCYLRALDLCYNRLADKHSRQTGQSFDLTQVDYAAFHAPYNKLVQKAYARLLYNDFLRNPERPLFSNVQHLRNIDREKSYEDRNVEQAFVALAADDYKKKVGPTTLLPVNVGNTYTAALYAGLLSLLYQEHNKLPGKRILMFSYGSGLASSMFTAKVGTDSNALTGLHRIHANTKLPERLASRNKLTAQDFAKTMDVRENLPKQHSEYSPAGPTQDLFPGTFYLTKKDNLARRFYDRA